MHYNDPTIISSQDLEFVVYKHGTSDVPQKKKDGSLSRRCVRYEITSIRKCMFFPPNLLWKMMNDPYKYFNALLGKLPFENWFLISARAKESNYNELEILVMADVSDSEQDPTLFVH